VETPAHSSAPGTAEHDREQRRPCQMQGRPCPQQTAHQHTRPDAGHAAPDGGQLLYHAYCDSSITGMV
jgi:hypothetical protein